MSLYNMLHGVTSSASVALAMLGLKPEDCGRFRDAWIEPEGERLAVFTRMGGGNRDYYEAEIKYLRAVAGYEYDSDDDFDSTYATFYYSPPERYRELAKALAPSEAVPSLWDKTQAVVEAIKAKPPTGVPPDRVGEIVAAIERAAAEEKRTNEPPLCDPEGCHESETV